MLDLWHRGRPGAPPPDDPALANIKRIIVLKARQLGLTWLMAIYAIFIMLSMPGSRILLVSRREEEATRILKRAVFIYRRLPKAFHPPKMKEDASTNTRFYLEAINSEIIATASSPDAGRSETITVVLVDEWAFQEYAREMYTAYSETVGLHGQIIGVSTANGSSGFFYDTWQAAKRGIEFLPIFLPWHKRPDRTREWYEAELNKARERGTLSDKLQELPGDELDAFAASIALVFPVEVIRACLGQVEQPLDISMDGAFRIYRRPDSLSRYCIGADVAEGIEGDFSTAVVMNAVTGEHVASFRSNRVSPDTFALKLAEIAKGYNNALIAVERNNHGILTINTLTNHLLIEKEQLFAMPAELERSNRSNTTPIRYGWKTTSASKPEAILSLRTAIMDGGFVTHCQWLVEEMQYLTEQRTIAGFKDYRAQRGHHDDMIIAAAIANITRYAARSKAVRKFVPLRRRLSR